MSEAKTEVWFYHLEQSSLDQVLIDLLEKTLARGWRALVRVRDSQLLESLDERLWTLRPDSFLPHGRADGSDVGRQPVLLTLEADNTYAAQALFIVDGADLGNVSGLDRCLIIFDGRDDAAVARAREQWKRVKADGQEASYWHQNEEGAWSRAA